jgi:hypothetical protein
MSSWMVSSWVSEVRVTLSWTVYRPTVRSSSFGAHVTVTTPAAAPVMPVVFVSVAVPVLIGATFTSNVCFGLNPDSGRAVTLCLDGKAGAKFVVMVDDGRYWYGPLSAYKRALDDPEAWTGVQAPEPISR